MTWVEQHIPCPCGKSSDAYSVNDKGWGTCFSCDKVFPPTEIDLNADNSTYEIYPHRNLTEETLSFWNIYTKMVDGKPVETGFVYPNDSVKIRSMDEKKFTTKGDMKEPGLFGQNLFDPNAIRVVTIVEGEYDAASVWQMLSGQSAVVSIRSSSSALRDCRASWKWLNRFDKIILALDNDTNGEKASRQIASLFDFNKVYKTDLTLGKDANEYLQADQVKEFVTAWNAAKRYTPDNIISTFDEIAQALIQSEEDQLATYPFDSLQNALYGLHKGEVIVFKGDEGIGKTEIFRAMENHILKTTKVKMALLHFEEDEATTIRAIATYHEKYPFVHPEDTSSNEEILSSFKSAVGGEEDRVYIYESFDVEDETQLLDNVRFLVSACGCEVIFLDHITWLATGMDNEDERRKLDRLTQKLKLLAKELKCSIVMISHTNDDGKTRGSRNITKVANTVIHLSRDKTSASEAVRRQLHFTIEKARSSGQTGPCSYAVFDEESRTLEEPKVVV